MRLALHGIGRHCGYGNVGAGLADGFGQLGVELVGYDDPAPASLWVLPAHFLERKMVGRAEWGLMFWESDVCPEGLYAGFDNFDGLFAATESNLASFGAHHPNVHRVDMGVDWRFWSPAPRLMPGTFRWLYTSHSPRRKGGDIAERAAAILTREHDMELVEARAGTDEELRDLYWSCHAYLQPSRGEGWGLMPHQALATGMPAVVSDCPGHREYASLPGCYLTATRPAPSILTFHGEAGDWWEPDVDAVVGKMRWVMDHYQQAHHEAQQAPQMCSERFDWVTVAQEIVDRIGVDVLNGPNPKPVWTPAVFRQFPITYSRTLGDPVQIGEHRLTVTSGNTVMVTADQKRVMREAGLTVEAAA